MFKCWRFSAKVYPWLILFRILFFTMLFVYFLVVGGLYFVG